MSDKIQLRSLRILAHCGAYKEEKERLQPFEIDLDIKYDQSIAGKSDNLNDAVDYEPLCEAILDIAASEEFNLIEAMAQRFVDALFITDAKIKAISITLNKLRPPLQVDILSAGVKIKRERS
jgi:dihydroneopterin aldolase